MGGKKLDTNVTYTDLKARALMLEFQMRKIFDIIENQAKFNELMFNKIMEQEREIKGLRFLLTVTGD